ncbi:(d)CMP kinase [bacterium]|nr:(d)CMP kinase [bacterium]
MEKVITIDGPAGVGKSTTAKGVAEALQWQYIDTGAMYRAMALAATQAGIDPSNGEEVLPVLERTDIELYPTLPVRIKLNGSEVTKEIRSAEVSEASSKISVHGFVRRKLVELQQELGRKQPSVLEGRDTGTVVFPNAGLKIFLDASVEERAARRLRDYRKAGKEIALEKIVEELRIRDQRDRTRKESPLVPADDAVILMTDGMSLCEQIDKVMMIVRERFGIGDHS